MPVITDRTSRAPSSLLLVRFLSDSGEKAYTIDLVHTVAILNTMVWENLSGGSEEANSALLLCTKMKHKNIYHFTVPAEKHFGNEWISSKLWVTI